MDPNEFKALFTRLAAEKGFTPAFGGWFVESAECMVVLDLQRSNFGRYFELNFKVYVQGLWGNQYKRSKELVKKECGDVFTRPPNRFRETLDLDSPMSQTEREAGLIVLFDVFLTPMAARAGTRAGLLALPKAGTAYLLPAVEAELRALG